MTFLNFSQLPESVFRPNFSGKHFPENQAKFSFDWKVFSVDQLFQWQTNTRKFGKWFPGNHFPENKHSQKGKHFPRNQTKFFFDWKVFSVDRKVFPLTRKCFPLTGKCFPLTNFPNGKQTQESLKSGFPENEFRETNMA
jgi:hypothetical protein